MTLSLKEEFREIPYLIQNALAFFEEEARSSFIRDRTLRGSLSSGIDFGITARGALAETLVRGAPSMASLVQWVQMVRT